jgi:phosphoglycerate dehydrogenase-like enzyme
VTITPHLAGDTHGFEDAMGHLFLDNAGRWLRHQPLLNVVNKQGGFVDQAATRPSIRSEQA